MKSPHKWIDTEIKLLKDKYDTITLPELQKEYFPYLTYEQVRSKKRALGLKSTNQKHQWNCYKNENFFSEPNLTNSYWAGFIAADGNIFNIRTSRGDVKGLKIQISAKDRDHLELFKKDIEYNGDILEEIIRHTKLKHPQTKKMNGKIYKSARLQFCNKKICKDLYENFNITQRKSLNMIPPTQLSLANSLAFIKGYSDGDGTISLYKKRKKYKLGWTIVGTPETLYWIQSIINKLPIINGFWKNKPYLANKHAKIHKINFTYTKYIVQLLKYLQTIETPELKRKWSKIEQYEIYASVM